MFILVPVNLILAGCLHGFVFDPEDGDSRFHPNVSKLVANYTPSHTRK
jgi:hypothetical protein